MLARTQNLKEGEKKGRRTTASLHVAQWVGCNHVRLTLVVSWHTSLVDLQLLLWWGAGWVLAKVKTVRHGSMFFEASQVKSLTEVGQKDVARVLCTSAFQGVEPLANGRVGVLRQRRRRRRRRRRQYSGESCLGWCRRAGRLAPATPHHNLWWVVGTVLCFFWNDIVLWPFRWKNSLDFMVTCHTSPCPCQSTHFPTCDVTALC
jgi:hypothetical protein